MMLSFDTAYRSFGGEVEASSTPTICRLPDSRRHQLSAIAHPTVALPFEADISRAHAHDCVGPRTGPRRAKRIFQSSRWRHGFSGRAPTTTIVLWAPNALGSAAALELATMNALVVAYASGWRPAAA